MQRNQKIGMNLRTQQIKIVLPHLPGRRSKNRALLKDDVLRGVFLVGLTHGKEDALVDVDVRLPKLQYVVE